MNVFEKLDLLDEVLGVLDAEVKRLETGEEMNRTEVESCISMLGCYLGFDWHGKHGLGQHEWVLLMPCD